MRGRNVNRYGFCLRIDFMLEDTTDGVSIQKGWRGVEKIQKKTIPEEER